MAAKFALIPADTQFLVTHTPPRGILDSSGHGCEALAARLPHLSNVRSVEIVAVALVQSCSSLRASNTSNRVHQFGHVHTAYGYQLIERKLAAATATTSVSSVDAADSKTSSASGASHATTAAADKETAATVTAGAATGDKSASAAHASALPSATTAERTVKTLFVNAAIDDMEQPFVFDLPLDC